MADRMNYVLVFKGAQEEAAAAAMKVEAIPGLVVLNRGIGSLRVEYSREHCDLEARVLTTGDWLVSEEQICHIS